LLVRLLFQHVIQHDAVLIGLFLTGFDIPLLFHNWIRDHSRKAVLHPQFVPSRIQKNYQIVCSDVIRRALQNGLVTVDRILVLPQPHITMADVSRDLKTHLF